MEEHDANISASESKITDYFSPKSDSKDKKGLGSRTDNASSVYPTPDSSPAKENLPDVTDSVVNVCTDHSPAVQSNLQNGKPNTRDNLVETKSDCSPIKVCKTDDSAEDTTKSESSTCIRNLNLSMNDQNVSSVPNSTRRKSHQHRICQISNGKPRSDVSPLVDNTAVSNGLDETRTKLVVEQVNPAIQTATKPITRPRLGRPPSKSANPSQSQPKSNVTTTTTPLSPQTQPTAATARPAGRRKKKVEPPQTSTITDYFPVRRSGRQTRTQIEKETKHHIEEVIKANCEDGLEIKEFEGKGRGVVSTKMFDRGDFVVEYAGELVDIGTAKDREEAYTKSIEVGCYMYFFCHKDKQYCVDATKESGRLGRLLNHSRDGNCRTRVVMVDKVPRLILVAAKDIRAGEELMYDYGDRSKAALEAHPWLKL